MPDYVCNCTSTDTNGVDHGKLTSWKESGRNLSILLFRFYELKINRGQNFRHKWKKVLNL